MTGRGGSQMGATNNEVWRNHYNPQFYLRQFVDARGEVLRTCRRPDGRLHEDRVSPKSTGYEEYLYSLRPERTDRSPPRSDSIETDILSPLDGAASDAMTRILAHGPSALRDDERRHWALFINSLLERHPKTLGERDAVARRLAEERRSEFLANRSADPESATRWANALTAIHHDAIATNAVRTVMVAQIHDTDFIDYLKGMTWIVSHIEENTEMQFVSGDAPLAVNFGNPWPIEFISVALSPLDLLFMCRHDDIPAKALVDAMLTHNLLLFEQCDYVYSRAPLWDGQIVRTRHAAETTLRRVPWRTR
jgi:Protein of unknown function (DUF4238)